MSVRINGRNFAVYLLILIAAVVFASFYGGLLPFMLLYGILLMIPVSVIYIVFNHLHLSVYQELDVHRVVKGEKHSLNISFENTGLFPVHDMELILHSDRCEFSGIKDGDRLSLGPRCREELNAGIVCIYGGTYEVGLKSLGFSDPFGIFSIIFRVQYSFRAIVSPRITDIANEYLDIENLINSTGSKSETRTEEIPGNEMRDYYPGDPYSSINWKVSARLDKLTVRVPDKLDTRTVTLILDASNVPERERDEDFLKRRDHFLEFAVSAVWYFARRGVPVLVIYPSGKITERQVGSYDGFPQFYHDISGGISYRSEDEKERMHRLAQERRTGYGNETGVIIDEDEWPGKDFCIVAD